MPINNCIASLEKVEQSSNQKSVPSLIWTTILVYRAVCVVLNIVLLLIGNVCWKNLRSQFELRHH